MRIQPVSRHHYDIIILGSSLASRIASALLAKKGLRVLTFSESSDMFPHWLQTSFHLKRILETLSGRSCLGSPSPFQVITDKCRLDFHGPTPLEEELRREFPNDHDKVQICLEELQRLGDVLEKIIWGNGGLPLLGMSSRLRFAKKRLRQGLSNKAISQPLKDFLSGFTSKATRQTLATLFSGLSLTPFEKLTVAEGALLWNSTSNPEGISRAGLDEILRRRYEQFHGETEQLNNINALESQDSRLTGVVLKNGARCSGTHYLLGSSSALTFLPDHLAERICPFPGTCQIITSPLKGALSSLLAPRIIMEAQFPLRLVFETSGDDTICILECSHYEKTNQLSEEYIRRKLDIIMPFATYQSVSYAPTESKPHTSPPSRQKSFPGVANPLSVGSNILLCQGELVLPSLGAMGEMLVAETVANYLFRLIQGKN